VHRGAFIGHAHVARRSHQQPYPQRLLETTNAEADGVRRDLQASARCCEAARLDNGAEGTNLIEIANSHAA